jgi:hypothetical protein
VSLIQYDLVFNIFGVQGVPYRNEVKGTITLHDGKAARTVATFTTTLYSVGFNRNEKK